MFRGTESFIKVIDWLRSIPKSDRPPIIVYGDPDIDGLVALREMVVFLEEYVGGNISYYCNSNRAHGFLLPPSKLKGYVVFAVDFAIDSSKSRELAESGVKVISMDHHDTEETLILHYVDEDGTLSSGEGVLNHFDPASSLGFSVVINNQYPFENKNFTFQSGMGVVWHCLQAYKLHDEGVVGDEFLVATSGESLAHKRVETLFGGWTSKALVGLTLLSDVRNIEMPYARVFLDALYSHPAEGYIGYLIEQTLGVDYAFGSPVMDRNYVDYTFSPKVNSLFRFNMENDAINFILGWGYPEGDWQVIQREFLMRLEETIEITHLPSIKFIEIKDTGLSKLELSYVENFIGLLASRHTTSDTVVIAYFNRGGKFGRASFRGSNQSINFREALLPYIDGRGHGSAFGIIGFQPSEGLFQRVSKVADELMSNVDYRMGDKFIEVPNLGLFTQMPRKGYKMGKENCYRLAHNREFIKYTGSEEHIVYQRGNDKYAIYHYNGIQVRTFEPERDVGEGLILPMLERGRLTYQLVFLSD